MKKLLVIVLMMPLLWFAQAGQALEATGVVEEIKICPTGDPAGNFIRMLLFRIDGNWFAVAADFYNTTGADRDNNITASFLYMAYAQGLSVDIKATGTWNTSYSMCGNATGAVFHNNAGDYIRLVRP